MDRKFQEAASFLTANIRSRLQAAPDAVQSTAKEICLRAERPLVVSCLDGARFLNRAGEFGRSLPASPYLVTKVELDECVRILTEYSLHSYKREINAGFLTVKGGHRAGVSGSAVCGGSQVLSVTDISSINLRVAREIRGAAAPVARALFSRGVASTLLVGVPASGKTTLLKDLARILGNGELGYSKKISLIDERGELAAVYRGVPQNDVGAQTDVFDGYRKGEGMAIAIRSMSPEVILLDELAGEQDAASIRQSLNAGAAVVASVHAGSLEELARKEHIRALLEEGAFAHIVLLRGAAAPCEIARIVSPGELFARVGQERELVAVC